MQQHTSDYILILGLDWCGSTIQTKLVPKSRLIEHPVAKSFWQEWTSKCCWYEVVGSARSIQKLKFRREATMKKISNLKLEPQSTSVLAQIKALNEELREVESYSAYLQASPQVLVSFPSLDYLNLIICNRLVL
jgi:hypothetical protein